MIRCQTPPLTQPTSLTSRNISPISIRHSGFLAILFGANLLAFGKTTPPEPAKSVKVAAVQCSAEQGSISANSRKATALVRSAARSGAKIIVLPELCLTGYLSQDGKTNWHLPGHPIEPEYLGRNPSPIAQSVPGPLTRHFCRLAKELGIYLTIPFIEVDATQPQPRYFNTICLADPHGKLVAHYRKIEPWPHAEKSWATPGNRGLQTFDTEYGRVGLAVCFDIHHVVQRYRERHLWALLYSVAWADSDYPAEWFYHGLPDKVRTQLHHHVVAANWSVDHPQKWRGFGFSEVISKEGKVLAAAKSVFGSEIVFADLPVAKSSIKRRPR